jgi:O-antigen ligase
MLVSGGIYYWSNYLFLTWFCLAYVAALFSKRSHFRLPWTVSAGLVLFFGASILSMPLGIQPLQSARELIILLGYLFLFLAGVEIFSREGVAALPWVVMAAAIIQVWFGIKQYFGGLQQSALMDATVAEFEQVSLKRIFGFTFSPDFYSCFLSAALVIWAGSFSAGAAKIIPSRWFRILVSVFFGLLLLVPVILSRSIGGFLALLAGMGLLAIMKLGKKYSYARTAAAALAALVIAGAVLSIFVYQRREYFFSPQNPLMLRLHNFRSGIEVWRERPLLGVGVGDFWIAYPKYRGMDGNETRYAHNNFIQVLAESGPVAELGLVLLVLYFLALARKVAARGDALLPGLWAGLAVLWSAWLWDYGLYVPELASLSFALLAALVAKLEDPAEKKVSGPTLGLLALLAGVLIVVSAWIFHEHRLVKKLEVEFSYGDPKTAKDLALKAARAMPLDDYPEIVLAWSLAREGAPRSEAVSHYRRAIMLNPRFAFWRKELGDYYLHQGELKPAEAEYLKARELYPFSPDLLARLVKLYRAQGDFKKAEVYGTVALSAYGFKKNALWEMTLLKLAEGGEQNRGLAVSYLEQLDRGYHDPAAKAMIQKIKAGGDR